ncbi:MAG: asparagine synthase (glutamine-hydrolyzing) [Pseudomonadales bacterium]|nr:asparagine synthase (glutamine-hydrolyzing) [Pseudomonadales bacterium]
MCGFALTFPENSAVNAADNLQRALALIEPRGPDEGHTRILDSGFFGHRRLSIIDLSGSQQPLLSPCQQYLLVFNGEIYNYQTLRKHLEDKWQFRTSGDTEVILAGLVCEGDNFINKLEGMWAFAFFDKEAKQLTLSKDHFGKKPIYYIGNNLSSGFHAASEIPALRTLHPSSANLNHDFFIDYWKYGFFLNNQTAYKEIHAVPPGSVVKVNYSDEITTWNYRQQIIRPVEPLTQIDIPQAITKIRNNLDLAVEKRLIADVEVGCFLSGGVDSSIIAMLASKKQPIKTYSMSFKDQSFDESGFACNIAKKLGTQHYTIPFEDPTVDQLEDVIFNRIGEPFIDTSILALEQLCKAVGKDLKVALSGDGADEIFGGYQRYGAAQIGQLFNKIPQWIRDLILKTAQHVNSSHLHYSHSIAKQFSLFVDLYLQHQHAYVAPRIFSDIQISSLLNKPIQDKSSPLLHQLDPMLHMMEMDIQHYLNADILRKVDAASMHHSLEVRSPFLDPNVVREAMAIPSKYHRKLSSGKKVLMLCFKNDLPDWLWQRKKHGFVTPVARWFNNELGDRLTELLHDIQHRLNSNFVVDMLMEHRSGNDHSARLWAIYIYLVWLKQQPGT